MRKNLKKNFSKKSLKKKSQNGGKKSKKNNKRVNKKSLKKGMLRSRHSIAGRKLSQVGGEWFHNKVEKLNEETIQFGRLDNVILSGWLKKLGGGLFRRWDERFFRLLNNGLLKYYKGVKKEGGMFFTQVGTRDVHKAKLVTDAEYIDKKKFQFAIEAVPGSSPHEDKTDVGEWLHNDFKEEKFGKYHGIVRPVFLMQASTEEDMDKWKYMLNLLSERKTRGVNPNQVINFESNCNNELNQHSECYNFSSKKNNENIICSPLNEILGVDLNTIHEEVKNKILSPTDNQKGEAFLGEGGFNTVYKLDLIGENSFKKQIVLRLTHKSFTKDHAYWCVSLNDELKGLYYQTKISKEKHKGGLGCEKVCKVYDFGIYKIFDKEYIPKKPTGEFTTTWSGDGIAKSALDEIVPFRGVYAFIEYLPGGDLFDRVFSSDKWHEHPKKVERTKYIIRQLLEALMFIHNAGYVHLDLKLENIMCVSKDNDDIKLIDFGRMGKIGDKFNNKLYTPKYVAPDFFYPRAKYTEHFDIWAVGIIFFVCIVGRYPQGVLEGNMDNPDVIAPNENDYRKLIEIGGEKLKNIFQKIFVHDEYTAEELLKDKFFFTGPSGEGEEYPRNRRAAAPPCCQKYNCEGGTTWRKCFKKKALELHPDKGGSDEDFKKLNHCNEWMKEEFGDEKLC